MSDLRVASRYAKSVFDLAIEMKLVDSIYQDMLLLARVCRENRKLVILLKNPIVRYDYKHRVLQKIFEKHVNALTLKFFDLISRKNRAYILPGVCEVFVTLYHKHKGIVKADVSTAVALSASLKKEFEAIIGHDTGKKVELNTEVNRSLLGGFVLRIGDNQVDNSLKSKLKKLRRVLKSRP